MHSPITLIAVLLAVLLAMAAAILANPLPQRGPPTGLPPPNPSATVEYAGNGGSAYVSAEGDYLSALNQCRALDETRGIQYVNVFTEYPNSNGRKAYSLQFFSDWACKGSVQAVVSFYYSENKEPIKGEDGKAIVPKSVRFVPA